MKIFTESDGEILEDIDDEQITNYWGQQFLEEAALKKGLGVSTLRVDWGIPEGRYWGEATPARDLETLIEGAFFHSYLQGDDWFISDATVQDTRWLRYYFLTSLDFALSIDAEPNTLHEDFDEEHQCISVGEDVRLEWRFDGRCVDGHYCFYLKGTGIDDHVLWLDKDGFADRFEANRLIHLYIKRNGIHWKPQYYTQQVLSHFHDLHPPLHDWYVERDQDIPPDWNEDVIVKRFEEGGQPCERHS